MKELRDLFKELENKYDFVSYLTNGFIVVKTNNKWGYVNEKGEEVIPLIYEFALPFYNNGLAIVEKNNKIGFIDKNNLSVWVKFDKETSLTPISRLCYTKYKNDYIITDFHFIGTLDEYKNICNKQVFAAISKIIYESEK